jgi:hypothetical protein
MSLPTSLLPGTVVNGVYWHPTSSGKRKASNHTQMVMTNLMVFLALWLMMNGRGGRRKSIKHKHTPATTIYYLKYDVSFYYGNRQPTNRKIVLFQSRMGSIEFYRSPFGVKIRMLYSTGSISVCVIIIVIMGHCISIIITNHLIKLESFCCILSIRTHNSSRCGYVVEWVDHPIPIGDR